MAEPASRGDWCPLPQPDPGVAPRRVWALGLTFADHVKETGERAQQPVVFAKHVAPSLDAHAITVPSEAALRQTLQELDPDLAGTLAQRLPHIPALLDYEVEVGLVLLEDWQASPDGQTAQTMPRYGLVLANDVTTRSIQMAGLGSSDPLPYWSAAKSLPGFLPVTGQMWCPHAPDRHAWPEVRLQTWVNGQLRQQASLSEMLYAPWQILNHAAALAPERQLHRHDIVLAGTPAGIALRVPRWQRQLGEWLVRACPAVRPSLMIGAWRRQDQGGRFLQTGDEIRLQADWLGQLTLSVHAAT